jgi:hypothetical protein
MTGKKRDRLAPRWVTTGVTALPAGWCNTYRTDNGDVFHEPAPALLLQQSDNETRISFASYESGCLTAVSDNPNYVDSFLAPDAALRPPKRTGPPPR